MNRAPLTLHFEGKIKEDKPLFAAVNESFGDKGSSLFPVFTGAFTMRERGKTCLLDCMVFNEYRNAISNIGSDIESNKPPIWRKQKGMILDMTTHEFDIF